MKHIDIFPDLRDDDFDGPYEDDSGVIFYVDLRSDKDVEATVAMKTCRATIDSRDQDILADYFDYVLNAGRGRRQEEDRRPPRRPTRDDRRPARRNDKREVAASGNTPPRRPAQSAARNDRPAAGAGRGENSATSSEYSVLLEKIKRPARVYPIARTEGWTFSLSDNKTPSIVLTGGPDNKTTLKVDDVIAWANKKMEEGMTIRPNSSFNGTTFTGSNLNEAFQSLQKAILKSGKLEEVVSMGYAVDYGYASDLLCIQRGTDTIKIIEKAFTKARMAIQDAPTLDFLVETIVDLNTALALYATKSIVRRLTLELINCIETTASIAYGTSIRFNSRDNLAEAASELDSLNEHLSPLQMNIVYATTRRFLLHSLIIKFTELPDSAFFPDVPYSDIQLATLEIEKSPDEFGKVEDHDLEAMPKEELVNKFGTGRIYEAIVCRRARVLGSSTAPVLETTLEGRLANSVTTGLLTKETMPGLFTVSTKLAAETACENSVTPFQVIRTNSTTMELFSLHETTLVNLHTVSNS